MQTRLKRDLSFFVFMVESGLAASSALQTKNAPYGA
jgi:hypothetical protein